MRAPSILAGTGGYGLEFELVNEHISLMSLYSIPQKSLALVRQLELRLLLLMKDPSTPDSFVPELLRTSKKLLQKRFQERLV